MKIDKVYLIVIAVLILIVGYMFVSQTRAELTRQQAGNIIKEIYELQYESDTEVLTVEENSGVYKIIVRFTNFAGQRTTQDVFLTKDGQLITDRFIIAENYRDLLLAEKGFIECVQGSGLRILGQANDTATLQQMQVLGTYAYKLFVSCDGAGEAACRNLGVEQYPTTVYNSTGYQNIYAPAFFAQLTGCELG